MSKSFYGQIGDQYDYIGVKTELDQFIVYNFIDFWGYIESVLEKNGITYEIEEFEKLQYQIYSKKLELIQKQAIALNIYSNLGDIIEKSIRFNNSQTFKDYEQENTYIEENKENYSLYGISQPIKINIIVEFKDYVLHICRNDNLDENGHYFIIEIPRIICSTEIEGFKTKFVSRESFERLAWIMVFFEHSFKDQIYSTGIIKKQSKRKDTVGSVINELKNKILDKKKSSGLTNWTFEIHILIKLIYDMEESCEVEKFLEHIIVKLKDRRNDIVHNIDIKYDFFEELIRLFEIYLFNIQRFCKCIKSYFDEE